MKNFLFWIVFIYTSSIANSQIWVQNNATWHFDYSGLTEGGFLEIEHIQDTVLVGQTAKMFVSTLYRFSYDQFGEIYFIGSQILDTNYTWNNSDTVFYLKNNQFEILYDFTKTTGDSWTIGHGENIDNTCSYISTVEIQNEEIYTLNEINYTSFDLYSADSCNYKMRGKYNSRFGAYSETELEFNSVFPLPSLSCDSTIIVEYFRFTFKCFEDDSLSFNPSGVDCEYMLTHLDVPNLDKGSTKIYPNPSSGTIIIEVPIGLTEIKVYNLTGKLCKKFEIIKEKDELDLGLENGIYFIEALGNNKRTIQKITIQ